MNDVLLNKKASIERCVAQIRRYYAQDRGLPFEEDHLTQDAVCMNLQRACELAIDMANHLIKTRKLGLPQHSKDTFQLLHDAGVIDDRQVAAMKAMVGFRNVLVHRYQELDLRILLDVVENRLDDLIDFTNDVMREE